MGLKIVKEIDSLEEFEPWSGAKYNYDAIVRIDGGERLIYTLEDSYPEGIDETTLNDILWFEDDLIKDIYPELNEEDDDGEDGEEY